MAVIVAVLIGLTVSIVACLGTSLALDYRVLAGFAVNGVLGLACLMWEVAKRPFSLMQVHWVFYLTFLVIAPVAQYLDAYTPWTYPQVSTECLLACNGCVFVWGALFFLASAFRAPRADCASRGFHERLVASTPLVTRRAALVLLALSAAAAVALVALVGIDGLFSRTGFKTGLGRTLNLVITRGVRLIPVFAFAFILVRCKQQGRYSALLLVAGCLLLLCDFPTAMPRFSTAAIYGGLALLAFRPLTERRGLTPLLLVVLLLVAFPALEALRRTGFDADALMRHAVFTIANLPTGFCNDNYDAYSMMARTLQYIGDAGATNGWQLLTALLFFVPRSIWPDKGVGSGALVAEYQGQGFTNVACPLPAEGLVNFDVAGLILFALAYGLICRRIDGWFHDGDGGMRVLYLFLCPLFFLMMRGDLLNSWASVMGFVSVFAVLYGVVWALSRSSEEQELIDSGK